MLFNELSAEQAGVDPISAPTGVEKNSGFKVPPSIPNTNAAPKQFVAAAKGGGPLTVQLYAESEAEPEEFLNKPPAAADRVWYFVEEISIAAGVVSFSTQAPIPGNYYARITAGDGAGKKLLLGVI